MKPSVRRKPPPAQPNGGLGWSANDQQAELYRAEGRPNTADVEALGAGTLAGTLCAEGVRAWWEAMVDSGRWYEVVVRDIRQIGPDRVAALGEIRDRGERLSPWCVIVRVREGLIIESHSYLSDEPLLERLGLLGGP